MIEKRTLKKEVSFAGVGIHSGKKTTLTLKPSSIGKILFRRLDLDSMEIEVDPQKVEIRNCVTLVSGEGVVQTIEHLMAVLYIFGLDSLEIELDGPEIPVMDGSAAPFAQAIFEAGFDLLPEKKKSVKILKSHTLQGKLATLSFSPDSDFRISYSINFPHPLIRRQDLDLVLTQEAFLVEIAPARTFGFLRDVPELQRRGLARGGTLENAIVLDDEKVISGPLRRPDEFVRHKILDLIGDLALIGYPLLGHFRADRAGHSLHLKAVRFLLQNPDFWAFEETAFPRHLSG
jgi:UDP-3-O-[3-hydroxymyristoyl] N-acetylglucosamine deacetylase